MSPFEIRLRGLLTMWRGYGRTYQIATHFDMNTADVRHQMLKLERRGIVRRSRHSAVNDISWEFTDGQGQTPANGALGASRRTTPPQLSEPVSSPTPSDKEGGHE